MIRDVGPKVFRLAVRTEDPALLPLAPERDGLGRLEEHDTIAIDDRATRAQLLKGLLEVSGREERRLFEPVVVLDPEFRGDTLRVRDHPVDRHRREDPALLFDRQVAIARAMTLFDLLRDIGHVLALIAVGRHRHVLAEELTVANGNGLAEADDLRSAVLDVILARHLGTGERQHRRERVPQRTAARVRERERSGRIRADELDLDLLARQALAASIGLAGLHDLIDLTAQPGFVEAHVHEAAARNFKGRDRRLLLDLRYECRRDVARRCAQRFCETHGDARRVVAVGRVFGHLDVDRQRVGPLPAVLLGRASERVRQCGGDEVTRGSQRHVSTLAQRREPRPLRPSRPRRPAARAPGRGRAPATRPPRSTRRGRRR